MGQRHNRRRTRPRSRDYNKCVPEIPDSTSHQPLGLPLAMMPLSLWSYHNTPAEAEPVNYRSIPCIVPGSPESVPAPIWHYGLMTWSIRETTSQRGTSNLETEQCRLFGGEPGDDVTICQRMLEYFDGLDYINS